MFKENIRERAANKLQLISILCHKIKNGEKISPELGAKALKDIEDFMEYLDKSEHK